MTVRFIRPTRHRIDWQSLYGRIKPYEDALVDTGELAEDNVGVVKSLKLPVGIHGGKCCVTINSKGVKRMSLTDTMTTCSKPDCTGNCPCHVFFMYPECHDSCYPQNEAAPRCRCRICLTCKQEARSYGLCLSCANRLSLNQILSIRRTGVDMGVYTDRSGSEPASVSPMSLPGPVHLREVHR